MKFLVDNQLPRSLSHFLSKRGLESAHVLELGMDQASDREIAQYAFREGRTIITKDADFSVMVTMGICDSSVIWVRVGNCRSVALLEYFSESLDVLVRRLQSGERVIELY